MTSVIVDELKRKALRMIDEDFRIVDFSFALPYTYVLIEGKKGKSLGVAMTLLEEIQVCNPEFEGVGVEEFIERANSLNIAERTIGLATINAISQYYFDLSRASKEDVVDVIVRENVKSVGIVGNISPIAKTLKERGYDVYVFERNPRLMTDETLSDTFEYRLLPKMDAVLISGTTLINDTIDLILERSKNAKLKVLVGPTAQALPEFFEGYLTHVASVKVFDIDSVLTGLKLGTASLLLNSKYSQKYTVTLSRKFDIR